MRIVLDTNVVLSALLWALLEDLTDVIMRPSATKRLALIGRSAREVLADVDDDQVIAAAVAARADLIVSGDRKHLLPLRSHQGIDIVDAAEAVRRVAGG